MKATIALGCLALGLFFPLGSTATERSYTYVEGGIARQYESLYVRSDENSLEAGGYVAGSYAFTDALYAFGALSRGTREWHVPNLDTGIPYDLDSRLLLGEIGLGYRLALHAHTDLLVEAAYQYEHFEHRYAFALGGTAGERTEKVSNGGYRISLGLREAFSPRVEGWLKLGYQDISRDYDEEALDPTDGELVASAGGQFRITPRWGVVVDAAHMHRTTVYSAGVRASF